ncbi:MAG TPA: hypothetical protein VIY09_07285 [Rhizomicrobium sp.]
MIAVRTIDGDDDPLRFEVVVTEGEGATRHHVTMSLATFDAIAGGGATQERCVEAAFRFLLDREPKEAILKRFDLAVISSYFPEFSSEFPRYISSR